MKTLSERAGLLFLLNIFKYAVGFIIPIILVRLLAKNDFGTYQQLLIISTVSIGIMRLGIPTSIYYFYSQIGDALKNIFILQTIVMLLLSGIFSASIIYVASPYISLSIGNTLIANLLPIYTLYILFYLASDYLSHLLISQDRYYFNLWLQVCESIVRVLILIVPLLLGFGIYGLIISIATYAFIRYVLYLYIIRGYIFSLHRHDLKTLFIIDQLKYSLPLGLTRVMATIGGQFDKILISIYFTTSQFAVYAIGALSIPLDVIFQTSVANILRANLPPLVVENKIDEVCTLLRNSVRKLSLIIWPISAYIFLYSQEFINILFTNNYADSVDIFRIYLIAMPLNALILSPIPQVFGVTKYNMYISSFGISFKMIFSLILINTIGYYGPAIVSVVTSYLVSYLFYRVSRKLIKRPIGEIFPLYSFRKLILTIVISSILSLLACWSIDNNVIRMVVGGAVYFPSILIVGEAFKIYSKGDKQLALESISKLPFVTKIIGILK